nr:sigma-70 family RNA polymerase sigma factor [uncultured Psychroserpens sp.]
MQLETLISQFQKKDEKAFEQLYNMYSDSIHGVIYNIVRDHKIAEEVMQDVFIKAWHKADTYNTSKGRFFTWILNIARNAAIDKTRSKSYKNSNKNLNAEFFVDILESTDNLNDKIDAIGIQKYVKALGEKCKKIIEYLYFKGYTQKETSEELDIPLGTIKTRNRNCIKDLRAMILE